MPEDDDIESRDKRLHELVKQLRNTPNWMREEFASRRCALRTYDRAPFIAADELENLMAENRRLRIENASGKVERQHIEQFWVVDEEHPWQVEAGPFTKEEEAHWTRGDASHLKVVKTRHPIYETHED
jgi:hypothetical protein